MDLVVPEQGWLKHEQHGGFLAVSAGGDWVVADGDALERLIGSLPDGGATGARLDLSAVERMDTTGAWLLTRLSDRITGSGTVVELAGLSERHQPLMELARKVGAEQETLDVHVHKTGFLDYLERIGKSTFAAAEEGKNLLNFCGLVFLSLLRAIAQPRRLRPKALITQIEQTGLNALLIVGLLQFLIGVVLTYLMADQFRKFGAEVFTVNLIGLTVLQEAGVLITAILLAGRSGSAFTAEIGTMKVNEEVDAMQTLGLDPIEVLVLPRVLGLLITLPLLTFFADIAGILGGALASMLALDITFGQFVKQLEEAVTLRDFVIGIVKAPVHAVIIAMVGCYEGLRVERSAESVGRMTTKSVVESIVLVIVATAVFAILFSILGIR